MAVDGMTEGESAVSGMIPYIRVFMKKFEIFNKKNSRCVATTGNFLCHLQWETAQRLRDLDLYIVSSPLSPLNMPGSVLFGLNGRGLSHAPNVTDTITSSRVSILYMWAFFIG